MPKQKATSIWVTKEQTQEAYEADLARVRAAGNAIEGSRCPNGCGTLRASRCRACGFRLQVVDPLPLDDRTTFFRRWHKGFASPNTRWDLRW